MTRFQIDPDQSRVWIDASSSVHPIHCESSGLEGWWQPDPPAGHIEITVSRLSSGNPLLDGEMRRRIQARRHPTISGELTTLDGQRAVGDITFMGQTRSVEGELNVSTDEDGTVHIEGEHTFDIREFGLEPPRILMLRVHPEVRVRIAVVAGPA